MCYSYDESILHILRNCAETKSAWMELLLPTHTTTFFIAGLREWILNNINCYTLPPKTTFPRHVFFSMLIWHAWKRRNAFVFNDECPSMHTTVQCYLVWTAHFRTRLPTLQSHVQTYIEWKPSANNWITLNTDVSTNTSSGMSTIRGASLLRWLLAY
ncbi:hypothetical protein V6N11_035166 [Hibiscus sabdariffa]|uniref:Reverse transcriptase zinc-binding domain-containing protein n=1 Tax=Hibiscus sabdariffa TaxID=183260 RepID=A0ABR2QZL6_9ROSI